MSTDKLGGDGRFSKKKLQVHPARGRFSCLRSLPRDAGIVQQSRLLTFRSVARECRDPVVSQKRDCAVRLSSPEGRSDARQAADIWRPAPAGGRGRNLYGPNLRRSELRDPPETCARKALCRGACALKFDPKASPVRPRTERHAHRPFRRRRCALKKAPSDRPVPGEERPSASLHSLQGRQQRRLTTT